MVVKITFKTDSGKTDTIIIDRDKTTVRTAVNDVVFSYTCQEEDILKAEVIS